mmetsp:Transcript_6281/g.14475  ORF Transcript_6281/g.14475 Transcript_6281/m.14475 type:complete len:263 (-) Transcript_6281:221-1009(-)
MLSAIDILMAHPQDSGCRGLPPNDLFDEAQRGTIILHALESQRLVCQARNPLPVLLQLDKHFGESLLRCNLSSNDGANERVKELLGGERPATASVPQQLAWDALSLWIGIRSEAGQDLLKILPCQHGPPKGRPTAPVERHADQAIHGRVHQRHHAIEFLLLQLRNVDNRQHGHVHCQAPCQRLKGCEALRLRLADHLLQHPAHQLQDFWLKFQHRLWPNAAKELGPQGFVFFMAFPARHHHQAIRAGNGLERPRDKRPELTI